MAVGQDYRVGLCNAFCKVGHLKILVALPLSHKGRKGAGKGYKESSSPVVEADAADGTVSDVRLRVDGNTAQFYLSKSKWQLLPDR